MTRDDLSRVALSRSGHPSVNVAAARLREAQRSGRPCQPVRDLFPDGDLESAYAVQSALLAGRLADGARAVGRKIGLTSLRVQAQLGVDQPDFGWLLDEMSLPSGSTVSTARLIQPRIEAEIAFVLAHDLVARGEIAPDLVRDAVGHAVAALEIVDSRIANWDIAIVDTVADNGSSGLFVLGEARVSLTDLDPVTTTMTMSRRTDSIPDKEIVSSGSGSDCLGDPLAAVAWLAMNARDRGDPLRAGDVVLSGALGPMVPVHAGDTFQADLSGVGQVEVSFASDDQQESA